MLPSISTQTSERFWIQVNSEIVGKERYYTTCCLIGVFATSEMTSYLMTASPYLESARCTVRRMTHTIAYHDDCRCGRGMQYDRSGTVVCEGEWVCDAPIVDRVVRVPESTDLLPPLHSLLVSLRIDTSSCSEEDSLLLHPFPRLRSFLQQTARSWSVRVWAVSH